MEQHAAPVGLGRPELMAGRHVEDALNAVAEPPCAFRPERGQRLVGSNGRGQQPERVWRDIENAPPALAQLRRRLLDVVEKPELVSYPLLPDELPATGDDLNVGTRLVQQRRGWQRGLPGADHRHPPAAELVQAVVHGAVRHEVGGQPRQFARKVSGKHGSVRVRRALIIMASASGTLVPAIARLVAADEDTVRDVIHAFNAKGLAALDPRWAGGRPRLISDGDIQVIVAAARTRPEKLGQPFTHWSLRKLAGYLAGRDRPVRVGRERLRQILHERGISFQRTRTWKESTDPDKEVKLDRIEYVTSRYPDRCFAFD